MASEVENQPDKPLQVPDQQLFHFGARSRTWKQVRAGLDLEPIEVLNGVGWCVG